MTLFEINKDFDALFERFASVNDEQVVDTETGELLSVADFNSLLEAMEGKREEKVRAICCKIKNLRADADQIKVAKDDLAKREKQKRNSADRLEDYLEWCLDGAKFECAEAVVKYTKSKAVVIDNTKLYEIPAEYLKERELKETDFNKTEIKKALQSGREIVGCCIEERTSMKVK